MVGTINRDYEPKGKEEAVDLTEEKAEAIRKNFTTKLETPTDSAVLAKDIQTNLYIITCAYLNAIHHRKQQDHWLA